VQCSSLGGTALQLTAVTGTLQSNPDGVPYRGPCTWLIQVPDAVSVTRTFERYRLLYS
jgi:hypothetical protein